jgi:hypothetical protein
MKPRIPRGESHAMLEACYDALERADAVNDPAHRLQSEDEAHAIWQQLQAAVAGPIQSRRLGAALVGRNVFDIDVMADDAELDRAFEEAGPWLLRDKVGVAAVRRALVRVLQDSSAPRWLVHHVGAELLLANFGGNLTWLARSIRPPGMKQGHGHQVYFDAAILCRVHYHAGYHYMHLGNAAAEVIPDSGGNRWDRLQRIGRDLKLQAMLAAVQQAGKDDRAAGRPFKPPIAADYDASQLEAVRREIASGGAQPEQTGAGVKSPSGA